MQTESDSTWHVVVMWCLSHSTTKSLLWEVLQLSQCSRCPFCHLSIVALEEPLQHRWPHGSWRPVLLETLPVVLYRHTPGEQTRHDHTEMQLNGLAQSGNVDVNIKRHTQWYPRLGVGSEGQSCLGLPCSACPPAPALLCGHYTIMLNGRAWLLHGHH